MPASTLTDYELLEAVRQNDKKAFEELFRRYWKKVYAMTYALVRSEKPTQEIVQDIFISLWDKRLTLSINHLPSYLYVTAKNRTLNYIASQITREKYWNYYKQFIPLQENVTANAVEFNELMEALEDGIEQLPEKSKKVFRLNHLEGHSISEISNLLNLSEKAIRYHLTQSVKKLRLHLKDYILVTCLYLIC
ncbi:MAG TPA: RNA polymerase sigma-70 factor [Chryseolinea sp.]|nr:RNA polymerase sigma-70 factor [Chryseolinea sp.]